MASPTISVIITSYNQKLYLKEAIESVLGQTVQPYEIIIVDDHSQDGSQDVIDSYVSEHPKLIRTLYHEINKGVSAARNHGLAMVRGEFFSTLDGDDRYLPRKLECELELRNRYPECPVIYSNYYQMNELGRRIWLARLWPYQTEGDAFVSVFSRKFAMRDMLVDAKCLEKVGGFDESFNLYEDWDWKIRLTKHYPVKYCHKPLLEHRRHSRGLASQSIDKHIDALSHVIQKNASLLEDLSVAQRRSILRSLGAVLDEMKAILALRNGHTSEFLRYTARCIREDPVYTLTNKKLIFDTLRAIFKRRKCL